MEPGFAKRLVHVLRAVYHMLRRGLCRKRLMMDLRLLLGRGNKLAGKALRNLVAAAAHHHHHHQGHVEPYSSGPRAAAGRDAAEASASSSSALSFCNVVEPRPGDVEFSCSATPSYEPPPLRSLFPFRIRGRRRGGVDFAAVARALERMNAQEQAAAAGTSGAETPSVAGATPPSPMLSTSLSLGRGPAGVRQLRVTDSPFPVEPEGDERVDAEADDFIKRFYEELRKQQAFATPDNNTVRRRG